MAGQDDLGPRVSALETAMQSLNDRVHKSEQNAAAARVLASGVDQDVIEIRSELRDFRQATTSTMNAMREDVRDLRNHMDAGFASVQAQFGIVDDNFTSVRGRLDAASAWQQQIVGMLTTLIERGDDRGDAT